MVPALLAGAALFVWVAFVGCSGGDPDADVLVPFGARWRYVSRVETQARVWAVPDFDTSAWREGATPLGYGVGDERTLLPHEWGAGDDDFVTYARRDFEVPNPAQVKRLRIRLVVNDGALVFLNGREVVRQNVRFLPLHAFLPSGTWLEGDQGRRVLEFWAPVDALRPGTNTLGVQVHQTWRSRRDLRFDLELAAVTEDHPLSIVRGPYLQSATPHGVTVRWRSNRPVTGRVRWGTDPQRLDRVVEEAEPTAEHEVVLDGLEPATRIVYRVESGEAASELGTFRSAPLPGADVPVRIWAIGDSGSGTPSADAVRDALVEFTSARDPDVWLMLGDNAYPSGSDGDYQFTLFDVYPELLRRIPLWPVLGNHDANSTDSRAGHGIYYEVFSMPQVGEAGGPPGGTDAFYAFDHGPVRFVAIDSQGSDFDPDDPMMRFLPRALDAPDARWLIVYLHDPAISGGTHAEDVLPRKAKLWSALLPVLEAADVDLVLAGHSHAYERSRLLGPSGGSLSALGSTVLDPGSRSADASDEDVDVLKKSGRGTVWVVAGSGSQVGHEGEFDHPAIAIAHRALGSLLLDVDGCRLDGTFIMPGPKVGDRFRLDKCTAD